MIRLAIIGTGFGRYCLVPAFRRTGRFQVLSLCSSHPGRARSYALELQIPKFAATWQDAVADPEIDALAIATPPAVQALVTAAALEAGKPVFAEKPFAADVPTAGNLARLARDASIANMVDFTFPELETWQRAAEAIQSQLLGELRHVALDWRMESFDIARGVSSWKTTRDQGGGVLRHFVSHSLYYLEWLLGPLRFVRASLSTAPDLSNEEDTYATIALRFANGLSGSISASNAAFFGPGHRLEVYGKDGSLELSNSSSKAFEGFQYRRWSRASGILADSHTEPKDVSEPGLDDRVQAVSRLAIRFADWIEEGRKSKPDFEDGLRVQKLIEAVEMSDRSNSWLDVTR